MYRKIQEIGLVVKYNDSEDETIRLQTHMTAALAFVPIEDVVRVYKLLHDHVVDDLLPIMEYFSETYIVGQREEGELLLHSMIQLCGIIMKRL